MPKFPRILFLLTLLVIGVTPARAWDDVGHEVVAYIAWEHMTPEARAATVDLMRRAHWGSGLPQLFPHANDLHDARARTFFMRASTWPDIVRSDEDPARKANYHRGSWHYINYFWEVHQGEAHDRPGMTPADTNLVERLESLTQLVRDESLPQAQRGIYVAWILHLIGDLHQPLHTSARITPTEPRGDQGGNLFELSDGENLHWYWDSILDRTFERKPQEYEVAYASRIARTIMDAYPPSEESAVGTYAQWAQMGYETAKKDVFLPGLERGVTPSEVYRQHAYETAAPALALAGYRLAHLLNSFFV